MGSVPIECQGGARTCKRLGLGRGDVEEISGLSPCPAKRNETPPRTEEQHVGEQSTRGQVFSLPKQSGKLPLFQGWRCYG